MRKIILFLIICLTCSFAYAAGIGNSIQPVGKHKVSFSLEDNVILDKAIKKSGTLTDFDFKTVNQTYGKIVFGLADNINIYAKLGASDIGKIKTRETDASTIEMKSNYGFLGGLGINGSVDVYKGLGLGADLQYGGWQVTVDEVVESGEKAKNVSGRIRNQEYQITLFATKKFSLSNNGLHLSPYLGGRYSYFKTETTKTLRYDTTSAHYQVAWDLANKDKLGLVLGTDIFLPQYLLQLNLEGRFFDETALTAGLSYKY